MSCDPKINDCMRSLVCQELPEGGGLCLLPCDARVREECNPWEITGPGGLIAQGYRCVDVFGLGAEQSRCLGAESLPWSIVDLSMMIVCDPRVPNLRPLSAGRDKIEALCVPVCSADGALACAAQESCLLDGPSFGNDDGRPVFLCGRRARLGEPCAIGRGVACEAGSICIGGLCREHRRACRSESDCSAASHRCVELDLGGERVAVCVPPCDPMVPRSCGARAACTFAIDGGETPVGYCRASGPPPDSSGWEDYAYVGTHLGFCGDPANLGTFVTTCHEGTICLPTIWNRSTDLTDAQCLQLCDPRAPERLRCPSTARCHPFPAPADHWGYCSLASRR